MKRPNKCIATLQRAGFDITEHLTLDECAALHAFIDHLEAENAELRARIYRQYQIFDINE